MSGFSGFAWPAGWPLLLLAPAVVMLLAWLAARRDRLLREIAGPRADRLSDASRARRRWRRWLVGAALLFSLVAGLRPVGEQEVQQIEHRGIDLLICLDVSRSMLARDEHGARLERAKQEIRDLVPHTRGDRLGLVAFGGEARMIIPLTSDRETFLRLVDLAEPASVPRGGTDLGAALEQAMKSFQGESGEHEVVVLMTDGEDLGQRGRRVAEECRAGNITVHCIGIGSVRGSKITLTEDGDQAFLRDRSGQEVISSMDPASLEAIARTAGGDFVAAESRPGVLRDLYDARIRPLAQKALGSEESRRRRPLYQWPLLAAWLLWILDLCLTDRNNDDARSLAHALVAGRGRRSGEAPSVAGGAPRRGL